MGRPESTLGLVIFSSLLGAVAVVSPGRSEDTGLVVKLPGAVNLEAAIAPSPSPLLAQTSTPAPVGQPLVSGSAQTDLKLLLVPISNPQAPADGRSTIKLEGQITDPAGALVAEDLVVTLTASAGKFIGADQDFDRPGFQVIARNGRFTVELQSTLAAQKVRIRAGVDLPAAAPLDRSTPAPLPPVQVDNNGQSRSGAVVSPTPLTPIQPIADGQALAPLTMQIEAYTQVEFVPNLRPFIVSGSINLRIGAGGTDYYSSFRDFLSPSRIDEDVRFDAAISAFATGRLGEWLLTAAVNNQRSLNQNCDGTARLFRDTQFCDQVYPVYGDSSTTDFLTPSLDSVYVRLERTSPVPGAGTDFAMWGDYSTPELATASQLFTATNRQLHGFKGNFNLGNLQITAFYGNNLQGFQRDTIAPNGTSGYYFLSRRLVVGGSETIYLETEEINRPGTVVERKQLVRSADYEIDYDRGSVLFRRPILQTDFDLFGRSLVRRIVVTYQYEGVNTGDTHLYAGRLQYNLSRELGRESWAGVNYLTEDQGDRSYKLYGADALISLGRDGRIVAEYARSTYDSIFRGEISGSAYRLEVNSTLLPGVIGRAYYRSVDENFTNNATFSFAPGQTRYGADIAARVTPTTQVQFQVDREVNFGIAASTLNASRSLFDPTPDPIPGSRVDNQLTTLRGGILQKLGAADLSIEWVNRNREDDVASTPLGRGTSNQIVSRLNLPLTETLTFRAQNEQNLGSSGDPLYPSRTTLGVDWAVMPGVTMRLAQQFISSTSLLRNNSITSLDTLIDQKISEDTNLTGRYSILNGVNGLTSQGAIGINRQFKLAPGLRMNVTYERIFGDIFAYTAAGQQFAQPYAVGQSAAALGVTEGDSYSVGLDYTDNPDFKASARAEYRNSEAGNNLVLAAAAAGKITPSLTALVRYQQANFSNQLITGLSDTINLKLGMAYRNPNDDKFNALVRYEFRQNPSTTPDSLLFGTGTGANAHLVALEAIYAPDWRWEFYGKFGLRSTRSYLARDLIGTNAITLAQFRTSYRLGYRWDLTGEVRWLGQSQTGYEELGYSLEAGYYLTPNLRIGAGYSFGGAYDRDLGDRTKGGFFVGINLKLNDLFEGFGLQRAVPQVAPKVAPPQQQESLVKPVASATPVDQTRVPRTTGALPGVAQGGRE